METGNCTALTSTPAATAIAPSSTPSSVPSSVEPRSQPAKLSKMAAVDNASMEDKEAAGEGNGNAVTTLESSVASVNNKSGKTNPDGVLLEGEDKKGEDKKAEDKKGEDEKKDKKETISSGSGSISSEVHTESVNNSRPTSGDKLADKSDATDKSEGKDNTGDKGAEAETSSSSRITSNNNKSSPKASAPKSSSSPKSSTVKESSSSSGAGTGAGAGAGAGAGVGTKAATGAVAEILASSSSSQPPQSKPPSTKPPSVAPAPAQRRYSSTTASPERPPLSSLRKLSIQPRTTQYEPHPLLQGLTEGGGSLLEELFAEHRSQGQGQRLEPRGAEWEKSSLLTRNAAGLTELEVYLQEKEQDLVSGGGGGRKPMTKAASVDSTGAAGRRAMMLRQQSMPETRPKPRPSAEPRPRLEPRTAQFEQHALLAEKDQTGMSLLDAFLAEKEQDLGEAGSDNGSITSKGKCSEKCTCKNANCPVCKGPKSAYSTPSSSGSHPPLMKKESSRETVIEPKANNKRVHFSESGEEEEEGEEDAEGGGQNNQKEKSDNTNNQKTSENNAVVTDKCKAMETKCKAKAKRKCVIS